MATDITQQRRDEDRLRLRSQLLESVGQALIHGSRRVGHQADAQLAVRNVAGGHLPVSVSVNLAATQLVEQ